MAERTSYEIIAEYLPRGLREAFLSVRQSERQTVTELRLNSGRPAAIVYPDKIMYLMGNGLTANPRNTSAVIVMPTDISTTVDSLSHYSIHSCSRQFAEGVFVLRHGVRVGMSGSYNADGILTEITGLNFRISRNVNGCADEVYDLLMRTNSGIIICGGVNSGKTTLLRDLCRQTGNNSKTVLVDERNEIACTNGGIIENDVGTLTNVLTGCSRSKGIVSAVPTRFLLKTNVLTGCSRSKGIVSAVRTLSPDFIFCDEISTDNDVSAILGSMGCGVRFCATIHGGNFREVMNRPIMKELTEHGVFGYAVMLEGSGNAGKIQEIRRIGDDI